MSFTIKHELSTPNQIVATTELYTIVVKRNPSKLLAGFEITWTTSNEHAFAGHLDISKNSSFSFEINPELPIYLIANFGDEYIQFKEEEYGIVIDSFDSEGDVIEAYGYTLNEEFEEEK